MKFILSISNFRRTHLIILFCVLNLGISAQDCRSHFPWILPDNCGYVPVILWEAPECYNGDSLIFDDEFEGDSLNKGNWNEPWIRCAFDGAKLEYNSFDNISVSNGLCHIVAKKEHVTKRVMDDSSISDQEVLSDGKPNLREFDYTSGTLVSNKSFLYGRYEARIRVPEGSGLWPAFWMFGGKRWNEIDFLDGYNGINGYSVGAIYDQNNDGCYAHEGESCGDLVSGISPDLTSWHTIACVFNPYSISWLLDDRVVHSQLRFQTLSGKYLSCDDDIEKGSQFLMRKNIPMEAMHLYLNLQVGSSTSPAGPVNDQTIFPSIYDIDYVRVYQQTAIRVTLKVSPDPSNGRMKISLIPGNSEEKSLQVFDVNGRLMKTIAGKFENEIDLDISFLNKGIYFIRMTYRYNEVVTKCIII